MTQILPIKFQEHLQVIHPLPASLHLLRVLGRRLVWGLEKPRVWDKALVQLPRASR